jgi:hypothetical protein
MTTLQQIQDEYAKFLEEASEGQRKLAETRAAMHEDSMAHHRKMHEARMQQAEKMGRARLELQELRNKVALKERREKAEAESEQRRKIAMLTIQAEQALAGSCSKSVVRGDDGKIAEVHTTVDEKALEGAVDLFAEIERLRGA